MSYMLPCSALAIYFLIFNRLNNAVLHFPAACFFMLRFLTKLTPRYFMHSALSMLFPFTFIDVVSHFNSYCLDPYRMNSVFLSFIFSQFMSIQCWIFITLSSRSCIVFLSGFLFCCQCGSSSSMNGHLQSHVKAYPLGVRCGG